MVCVTVNSKHVYSHAMLTNIIINFAAITVHTIFILFSIECVRSLYNCHCIHSIVSSIVLNVYTNTIFAMSYTMVLAM